MPRLGLLLALLVSVAASAQPQVPLAIDYAISGTASYDPAVPTPEEVLGYTIGERVLRPALVGVSKGGAKAAEASNDAGGQSPGLLGRLFGGGKS